VTLDVPLPSELSIGRGTALFVCGWCFHRSARIRSLEFIVDGERQPVMAHGMPRLDPFVRLHPRLGRHATAAVTVDLDSPEDPALHSYQSGFWGMVAIAPPAPSFETVSIGLRAELDPEAIVTAELARIPISAPGVALPEPADMSGEGPLIAICMATHEPPVDLLVRQLESIRAQTHRRWVCLISDDCSSPERFHALQSSTAGDPRFVVSRSPRRLDFYANFERALSMVPAAAEYVALADQDDFWHPDKLAALAARIGSAKLVYSDARVVARDGELICETYWSRRRNNHQDLLSLLVANSVTGAASLFRSDLLDDALPFPPAQFAHYHDHWLALTALALGEIAFVGRPLYDYVQHPQATLGHAAANRMPTLRERLRARGGDRRDRVRMWRMHYFVDVCRLLQCATILELRCGERISPAKHRVLERFLRADESLCSLAELCLRGMRELLGRRQTLGAEWMLFHALAWRRLLSATARKRPQRRIRLDAVPPPDLAPRPGRRARQGGGAGSIAAKIAPLELAPSERSPARVNLLVPTVDLEHFFGGYITKFNLARRLVELGVRVRIVTVDPVAPLPRSWRRTVEAYAGLGGVFDKVELAFGREGGPLEVSPTDRFIATTWWTAHIAHHATRSLGAPRFLYLIQEYEPFTFPMGTYAALASESYGFPHFGLFSSEPLREYFRRHELGAFADEQDGELMSASFQNAITAVRPPRAAELAARGPRRLLFYARPEPHAARNLFELGVLGLTRALALGAVPASWELNGIGSLRARGRVSLAEGVMLELLPRAGQEAYAASLREHDVGLALMYTPHPSLVPIEMASAGMLTVTNTFENKTREAMAAISPNLIAVPPTVEAIAAALGEAVAGVADFERRVSGSEVRWSRDWDQSFDDALLTRLVQALRFSG